MSAACAHTCWHDGGNAKVGESPVLEPQRLLAELHLDPTLRREKAEEERSATCEDRPPLDETTSSFSFIHLFIFLCSVSCVSVSRPPPTKKSGYLQHQDEVVHRFVALEQEVLRRPLVPLVELELLNHAGVLDQPQQDLLRDVGRLEGLHLWRRGGRCWMFACIPPPQ